MPLYEYQCESCSARFERIQKFSDPPETVCPTCGGHVLKLPSSPAIQFKGSGFYITDYAKKGDKRVESPGSTSSDAPASGASSSSDTSGSSKEGSSSSKDSPSSGSSKDSSSSGKDAGGSSGGGSGSKESSKPAASTTDSGTKK
jgi:putative FmdB family regulatory protein